MRARTKFQKKIVALSEKLPGLTEEQVTYLREEIFEHGATLLKSGKTSCLDCGHQWQNKDSRLSNLIIGTECPSCKREVKVQQTQKKVFSQERYYQVIDTFRGHQVIRLYQAKKLFKAGKPQEFHYWKVYENWFSPEGKTETIGRYMTSKWNEAWGGEYELRSGKAATNYDVSIKEKLIYPKKKFIPTLKRNGLKTSLHDMNPFHLFMALFHNPKAETLLKAKQYHMLSELTFYPHKIENRWSSIKICIRNKYHIAEPTEWLDYINLLEFFDKDIHNAKFVCPKILVKEHNRYVEKKRKFDQQERITKMRKQLSKFQKEYAKKKAPFMGLHFSNETLNVRFLNSVEEVMKDADALRHCAFTNEYYNRSTLLFSIMINGERLATAEVNYQKRKILQVRGMHNGVTKYDQAIHDLITANMKKIVDCTKPKRKTKRNLAMAS